METAGARGRDRHGPEDPYRGESDPGGHRRGLGLRGVTLSGDPRADDSSHSAVTQRRNAAATSGLRPRFPGRSIGTARFTFRTYTPLVAAERDSCGAPGRPI